MATLWITLIPFSRRARFHHQEVVLPHIYAGNKKILDIPAGNLYHKYILPERKRICFMLGCNTG